MGLDGRHRVEVFRPGLADDDGAHSPTPPPSPTRRLAPARRRGEGAVISRSSPASDTTAGAEETLPRQDARGRGRGSFARPQASTLLGAGQSASRAPAATQVGGAAGPRSVQSWRYDSSRKVGTTRPNRPGPKALGQGSVTPTTGRPQARAKLSAKVTPMRTAVKRPGPVTQATPFTSERRFLAFLRSASSAGHSASSAALARRRTDHVVSPTPKASDTPARRPRCRRPGSGRSWLPLRGDGFERGRCRASRTPPFLGVVQGHLEPVFGQEVPGVLGPSTRQTAPASKYSSKASPGRSMGPARYKSIWTTRGQGAILVDHGEGGAGDDALVPQPRREPAREGCLARAELAAQGHRNRCRHQAGQAACRGARVAGSSSRKVLLGTELAERGRQRVQDVGSQQTPVRELPHGLVGGVAVEVGAKAGGLEACVRRNR